MDDGIEQFAEAVAFEQHRHRHLFNEGESEQERTRWLRTVEAVCKQEVIAYAAVRETARDGLPGYEFGFVDQEAFSRFRAALFKEGLAGHGFQIHFEGESQEYKEAYLAAAQSQLSALGIKYLWRWTEDRNLKFSFDRSKEHRVFSFIAADQDVLFKAAEATCAARRLLRQLSVGDAPQHGLGYDP